MQQPNIVFIFMDDMGWRDLGCSGSTFYETPNIDQICGLSGMLTVEGKLFVGAVSREDRSYGLD